MLRLPERFRSKFSKPFGKLYRGKGEELMKRIEEVKNCKILACVGDIVSYYALKLFEPDIIVIDGKTVRKEISISELDELSKGYIEIKANNPAGCITCDLISKLREAVNLAENGKKVKVIVEGEEDLAVAPLGLLLPNSSLILYGQPNEGVVALMIDDDRKSIILEFLRCMERVGECDEWRWLNGSLCRKR